MNKENRWVILAHLIPWWKVEEKYAQSFKKSFKGQKAVSVRVALGSLIIQQRLGLSDRATVQQIKENPYLQYFIGLPGFQETPPFHPSLMTHFRKRLGADMIHKVNEWITLEGKTHESQDSKDDNDPSNGNPTSADSSNMDSSITDSSAEEQKLQDRPHQGKLLLDTTCVPADMAYPTDLDLLNEAREKLEQIIDVLHAPHRGSLPKLRTYRKKARKAYLAVAKKRNVSPQKLRKAIGQQLRYIARNLRTIAALQERSSLSLLSKTQYKQLLVIHELYRQQSEMYAKRSHRIEDLIVSIHQPHVRQS